MSQAKLMRESKRQLGQFLTPPLIAEAIVRQLAISPGDVILEPSLGTGAFVFALLDALGKRLPPERLMLWTQSNLYGCEIDKNMMESFAAKWKARGYGEVPKQIEQCDFFRWLPPNCNEHAALNKQLYSKSPLDFFDLIIGNPPFGGSINPLIQDKLDQIFGVRNNIKIKKETYAFFLIKCLDILKPGGRLCFICSDTILTISTMRGLRYHLQEQCEIQIDPVPGQFDETTQRLVLITLVKRNRKPTHLQILGSHTRIDDIEATPNLSWRVNSEYARYFKGSNLGDKFVASSGMTVGRNAIFIRRIANGRLKEPYRFSYAQEPITLAREIEKARLGKMSNSRMLAIREHELRGDMQRIVCWEKRETPLTITLPDKDYCFYNKATSAIIYTEPQWAIFWRDNGEYVYTFKKTGNWYLRGIGGKSYFGREGLTWSLIAPRLYTRWLPPGLILDSGAPCAFLRPGVERDELFFVMGWTLTNLCTDILKNVINHTRNIQSKDFERLPYPSWVPPELKAAAVARTKNLIQQAKAGKKFDMKHPSVMELNQFYEYQPDYPSLGTKSSRVYAHHQQRDQKQLPLPTRLTLIS